jgi:hypothetical protein
LIQNHGNSLLIREMTVDLYCLKVLGNPKTEFIFVSDIVIPSFEICRPMYSTVASPNLHLDAFK